MSLKHAREVWNKTPDWTDNTPEAQFVRTAAEQAIRINAFANNGKDNGGEVYTPRWVIVDMIKLCEEQAADLNKSILDQCCGTGNFIAELLCIRFISAIKLRNNFEKNLYTGISNLYAIDFVPDSITKCKQRLTNISAAILTALVQANCIQQEDADRILCNLNIIFEHNIVSGDALLYRFKDGED